MLIELITPLMLATAPMTVDTPQAVYDHSIQRVVALNGSKDIISASSTRTFLSDGKPYDSDND